MELANNVGVVISAPRTVGIQCSRANPPSQSAMDYFRITHSWVMRKSPTHHASQPIQEPSPGRTRILIYRKLFHHQQAMQDSSTIQGYNKRSECIDRVYYRDLPPPSLLTSEFKRWNDLWCLEGKSAGTISEALQLCVKDIYPNVHQQIKILLTIPVTTAEVERGNSKLKLLKTRLRSVMGEERLSSLALLYIHNNFEFNYREIVERFAHQRPRRINIEMSL